MNISINFIRRQLQNLPKNGAKLPTTLYMDRKKQEIKKEATKKLQEYIELIKKDLKIEGVYLFGSQVTGKSHNYSDYDLAIITNEAKNKRHELLVKLLGKTRDIDLLIEPHPMTQEDLNDPAYLLGMEVKRHGVRIA